MPNSVETPESEQESFRKYCRERLSMQKEFIKLFYEVLAAAAHERKVLSHRRAFELLNKLYFNLTGKYRFADYGLFLFMLIRLEHQEGRHSGKDQVTSCN